MERPGPNRSKVKRKRPDRGVEAGKPVAAGVESSVLPGRDPGPPGAPSRQSLDPDGVLALDPEGSCRPVDARWRLAAWVAAGGWVPDGWADPWVRLAARHLAGPPPAAAGDASPAAVGEAKLLADRGPGDWGRAAVEGRLLAAEPHAVIAAKEGMTVAAVGAYAALFYDVADALPHRSHIAHRAIGLHSPRAATDPSVHVRAYGYYSGVPMLEAALDAFAGADPDDRVSEERRAARRAIRVAVRFRMTPVTPADAAKFLRLRLLHLLTRRPRR